MTAEEGEEGVLLYGLQQEAAAFSTDQQQQQQDWRTIPPASASSQPPAPHLPPSPRSQQQQQQPRHSHPAASSHQPASPDPSLDLSLGASLPPVPPSDPSLEPALPPVSSPPPVPSAHPSAHAAALPLGLVPLEPWKPHFHTSTAGPTQIAPKNPTAGTTIPHPQSPNFHTSLHASALNPLDVFAYFGFRHDPLRSGAGGLGVVGGQGSGGSTATASGIGSPGYGEGVGGVGTGSAGGLEPLPWPNLSPTALTPFTWYSSAASPSPRELPSQSQTWGDVPVAATAATPDGGGALGRGEEGKEGTGVGRGGGREGGWEGGREGAEATTVAPTSLLLPTPSTTSTPSTPGLAPTNTTQIVLLCGHVMSSLLSPLLWAVREEFGGEGAGGPSRGMSVSAGGQVGRHGGVSVCVSISHGGDWAGRASDWEAPTAAAVTSISGVGVAEGFGGSTLSPAAGRPQGGGGKPHGGVGVLGCVELLLSDPQLSRLRERHLPITLRRRLEAAAGVRGLMG